MLRFQLFTCVSLMLLASAAAGAPDPSPDPTASVVYLRKSCDEQGTPIQNCFEDEAELWNNTDGWIWTDRNQNSPLIVHIGPGTYGKFTCNGTTRGNVAFRGSGRDLTILRDASAAGEGATIQNCVNLSFSDMGFWGGKYGVNWIGTGDATWYNADFVTMGLASLGNYGWTETCDELVPGISTHRVYNSRTRNTGSAIYTYAWHSGCAETYYFGGEIEATIHVSPGPGSGAVVLDSGSRLETFGTPISAETVAGVTGGTIEGVRLLGAATFVSHGGSISAVVESSASSTSAVGLISGGVGGNIVRTEGTAFFVSGGSTGSTRRVSGASLGDVYVWRSGPTPPQSSDETNRIRSLNGHDVWIETDCDNGGNCNGAGSEAHMMIYNHSQCPAHNPWFNMQTEACRQ